MLKASVITLSLQIRESETFVFSYCDTFRMSCDLFFALPYRAIRKIDIKHSNHNIEIWHVAIAWPDLSDLVKFDLLHSTYDLLVGLPI